MGKKVNKKLLQSIPELICTRKADAGCNNAFYTVRIPVRFLPLGELTAAFYEYRFIGMKEDIK